MIAWYMFAAVVIKYVSPPFGMLTAIEQKIEGEYRTTHSEL